MATVLTGLIPVIYTALDEVLRELTGITTSVKMFPGAEGVAKDQSITYGETRAGVAQDVEVAMTQTATTGTIDSGTIIMSNAREVPITWTGEGQLSVGMMYNDWHKDEIKQAIRTLLNEVEGGAGGVGLHNAYKYASRAYGTPGTTPFSTAGDFSDATFTNKILNDNGATGMPKALVLSTTAGATLKGKQSSSSYAYNDLMLTQGTIFDMDGMAIKESGFIASHTRGTATGSTTDNAGYAVGARTITLDATGTGTILAGDFINLGSDTNKYMVVSGNADVSSGGTITIGKPGLISAITTTETSITVGASSTRNLGFQQSSIVLAARPPKLPNGGDAAIDSETIIDPRTGVSLLYSRYGGKGMITDYVGLVWGWKVVKQEGLGVLLG